MADATHGAAYKITATKKQDATTHHQHTKVTDLMAEYEQYDREHAAAMANPDPNTELPLSPWEARGKRP